MTLRELVRSDLARFTQTFALRGQRYSERRVLWESVIFKAGFQAVLLYRVGHWLFQRGWNYVPWFLSRLNVAFTGADIEYNADIGPGLFIAHSVGIVIGRGTVIGAQATLFHGVTFGVKGWRPDQIRAFPRVGDRCYFFAGAAVLGGITIGDDCVVGAHAVVAEDMPAGSLATGVPATILPGKGQEATTDWVR